MKHQLDESMLTNPCSHISMWVMLVICPQCKAQYQLGSVIKNAILVCHRCGDEFNVEEQPIQHISDDEPSLFEGNTPPPSPEDIVEATAFETPAFIDDEASISDNQATISPRRKQAHMWPWLIFVLICVAGLGLWKNQSSWLEQPWARSLMMNLKLPVTFNPNDWSIATDNLQSQWVKRQDDSRILLISGYIHNRLLSDQLAPPLRINFHEVPNGPILSTYIMPITEPPSLPQIRHAPFVSPDIDSVPIAAGGMRAFTLVIENAPEDSREFTLGIATPTTL